MAEYVCELPVEGMASFMSGTTTIPVHERIVRCRDCEHSFEEGSGYLYCGRRPGHCFEIGPNGFCAWGVRKEQG